MKERKEDKNKDNVRFGRERRYQLNPIPLRDVRTWIAQYERFWQDRLSALRDVLDEQP